MKETKLNMSIEPSDYKGFMMDSFVKENPQFSAENLEEMGITIADSALKNGDYIKFIDESLANGQASVTTPIQFAQFWIPDLINALYRGRSFNKIFGSKNIGTWELEQIVYSKLTLTGRPNVYDDFSRANLASYNLNFETRETLRVEMGVEVTRLEEARAAQMRQNAHGLKKNAVTLGFDIFDNHLKYFGFNDGAKRIYGVLAAPNGDIHVENAAKTFAASDTLEIITFLQSAIIKAQTRLQGNYDPITDKARLVLPLSCVGYMTTANQFNLTPMQWLNQNYPKVEVAVAAELDKAAADGDNIAIFYVPEIDGLGTDRATMAAYDTSKLRLIGAVPTTKGFEESYSFATAGVIHRCPMAFTLFEGV